MIVMQPSRTRTVKKKEICQYSSVTTLSANSCRTFRSYHQ